MGDGKSRGNVDAKSKMALTPPAEAPITMIGWVVESCIENPTLTGCKMAQALTVTVTNAGLCRALAPVRVGFGHRGAALKARRQSREGAPQQMRHGDLPSAVSTLKQLFASPGYLFCGIVNVELALAYWLHDPN
jgi:hypothetical protein